MHDPPSIAAGPFVKSDPDCSGTGVDGNVFAHSISPRLRWREVEVTSSCRPGDRSGAASVTYGNALYVFGGYGGSGRLDDLYKYDFEEKRWSKVECESPPTGRENNGAVLYGHKMYLFGGYSGHNWLNDFHAFDFETMQWSEVVVSGTPPTTRFGYVSAVSEDGVFLLFGGYDGVTWLNDVHELNFATCCWRATKHQGNIPSGRSCPSWVTYKGAVYLFGGYDGIHRMNDFHQFKLSSKTWSLVNSCGQVPSPRYFHASVVYGDSLFLFGGYSGQERLNDLYEFRFDIGAWILLDVSSPPSGRSSLVAQTYKNSLYIFGGYNGTVVLNDFYEFRFDPVAVPPSSLVDDLSKLVNNEMLHDVVFVIEGQNVYATRSHLAARSDHFRALFYGGMRESSHSVEPVVIPDIQLPVFLALLEYLYCDRLPDSTTSELAVQLLIAAEKFMLDRLKALCQDIIRRNVSVNNVVNILLTASNHRAESLKEFCMDFISNNSEKLKQTNAFKDLISEPTLLYEILMQNSSRSLSM